MKQGTSINPSIISRLRENSVNPDGLHHLDISNSQAGPKDMKLISDAVRSNFQTIEVGLAPLISIDVSCNSICGLDSSLKGIYDANGLNDFCNTIILMSKVSRLRKINFSKNVLEIEGFSIIADLIANGPNTLSDVIVRSCYGNPETLSCLVKDMHSNKSLLVLDIADNLLGHDGSQSLASMLHSNHRLKHLNVTNCGIGTEGAISIFQNLDKNQSLEILFIGDNNIGDIACNNLALMLEVNKHLKYLDIQENQITDVGMGYISESLITNKTLTYLGLQWNFITNEGASIFGEAMTHNTSFRSVSLLGTAIAMHGIIDIVEGSLVLNNKHIEIDIGSSYVPSKKGSRPISAAVHSRPASGSIKSIIRPQSGNKHNSTSIPNA